MAINHTRLCTRLGKLIGGLNDLNTWRGSTLDTRFTTLDGLYATVNPELRDGLWTQYDVGQSSLDQVVSYYQSLATGTLISEVNNDRPDIPQTLSSCAQEWYRQFARDSQTFEDSSCTATVTAGGSNTTDAQIKALVPGDLVIPDNYVLTITQDQVRGATAYSEVVNITGTELVDPLSYRYPVGSGVLSSLQLLDGATDIGLTNGSLSAFTVTDTPDDWTVVTGAVGVNVLQGSGIDPRGGTAKVLKLAATATSPEVTNSTYWLQAGTVVTWSLKLQKLADAGGTITVKIGGNTVYTALLAALPAIGTWEMESGIYNLASMTAGAADISIKLTGGVGNSVAVAHVGLQEITPYYNGGVYMAGWSGDVAPTVSDNWTVAVALSTGSMTTSLWRGIDRFLGMRDLGLAFPTTTGVATQLDALVS